MIGLIELAMEIIGFEMLLARLTRSFGWLAEALLPTLVTAIMRRRGKR